MTEDTDIMEISEITLEDGAFGSRYVVKVDGVSKKFRSEEKAVAYRNEQLALQREQQKHREAERKEAQLQAEYDLARAKYDKDPEYFVMTVRPDLRETKKKRDERFLAIVDLEAYARDIRIACFKLWRGGYEIISITPLLSGYGAYDKDVEHLMSGNVSWGAGWGFSYTDGVVIVGRKEEQFRNQPSLENSSKEEEANSG